MKHSFYLLLNLLISLTCTGQQMLSANRLMENIVETGNREFGFISGANDHELFVLLARPQKIEDEPVNLSNTLLKVYFYNKTQTATGTLVRRLRIGNSQVGIYSIPNPSGHSWQKYSWDLTPQTQVTTFVDDNLFNGLWYTNNAPLTFNENLGNGEIQYRIGRDEVFNVGMPVLDSRGALVGLIAERQHPDSKILVNVVSIQEIYKKMEPMSACVYFGMVRHGMPGTPCEMAQQNKKSEEKQERLSTSRNKKYLVGIGPAGGWSLVVAAGGLGGSLVGGSWTIGGNIYFAPDSRKIKLTISPRFNTLRLNTSKDFDNGNQALNFKVQKYRLHYLEAPIVLEIITHRDRTLNSYIGFGYIPGIQSVPRYDYTFDPNMKVKRAKATEPGKTSHKAIFELGFEGRDTRVSLHATYLLNGWGVDHGYLLLNGINSVAPYEGIADNYLGLGITLGFRLWGSWGLGQ